MKYSKTKENQWEEERVTTYRAERNDRAARTFRDRQVKIEEDEEWMKHENRSSIHEDGKSGMGWQRRQRTKASGLELIERNAFFHL